MADTKPTTFLEKYRPALAEFFATTLLVWCGCGTVVSTQSIPIFFDIPIDGSFLMTISLAFGLAVVVLVYAIAPISGGHMNPAVTFAFVLCGKMPIVTGIRYIAAQCLGAFLGSAIVWGTTASDLLTDNGTMAPFNVGLNVVRPTLPVGSAFLGEFMGTYLLVFTVIMTAVHAKSIAQNLAPLAIGWAVLVANLVLIPFTGCGINPARSLGPMLITIIAGGKAGYEGWWIYYTAPFVGSAFAVVTCKYVFEAFADVEEEEMEGKIFEKESRAAQEAGAKPKEAAVAEE